jgi:hypothetical protein
MRRKKRGFIKKRYAKCSMFMREENLLASVDGICASCSRPGLKLAEQWEGDKLYKVGSCASCNYEFEILLQRK